jgi:hypothetical protein
MAEQEADMTDFDWPDAPAHDDADARIPGVPSPDATAIAIALNRIAAAIERLAQSSPGGVPAPGPSPTGAPSAPPGGPSNGDSTQIKMSKKVFAICKSNNWGIQDVGLCATNRYLGADSRKWSETDLKTVLDVMKRDWGVG